MKGNMGLATEMLRIFVCLIDMRPLIISYRESDKEKEWKKESRKHFEISRNTVNKKRESESAMERSRERLEKRKQKTFRNELTKFLFCQPLEPFLCLLCANPIEFCATISAASSLYLCRSDTSK